MNFRGIFDLSVQTNTFEKFKKRILIRPEHPAPDPQPWQYAMSLIFPGHCVDIHYSFHNEDGRMLTPLPLFQPLVLI